MTGSSAAQMYKTGFTIKQKHVPQKDRPTKCAECYRTTMVHGICSRCGHTESRKQGLFC